MNAPTLEHVTDTFHDVAHQVADRAPDIASAVGRNARSTAATGWHTVTNAVARLAYMTPFLDAPTPQRRRGRWLFRAAVLATIAGIAMWMMKRRRTSQPWYEAGEPAAPEQTDLTTTRRYATAGH